MGTDSDAGFGSPPQRRAQDRRVASVKTTGNVGRSHDFEQRRVVAGPPCAKAFAQVGAQVDGRNGRQGADPAAVSAQTIAAVCHKWWRWQPTRSVRISVCTGQSFWAVTPRAGIDRTGRCAYTAAPFASATVAEPKD